MACEDDIEVGGAALITARFYSYPLGVKTLTDPSDVFLDWIEPDGTTTGSWQFGVDVEVIKDAVGVYHAVLPATSDGIWRARFRGTGAVVAAQSVTFCVLASAWP